MCARTLRIVRNKMYRRLITKLRLSTHNILRIESGRYGQNGNVRQREIHVCRYSDIEDEFHFVIVCSKYKHDHDVT